MRTIPLPRWGRPRGIRAQLTALTVLLVVFPLLAGVLVVILVLHTNLMLSLADQAEVRAHDVAEVVATEGIPGVASDEAGHLHEGATVQILDLSGQVIYAALPSAGVPLTSARPQPGEVVTAGVRTTPWGELPRYVTAAEGVSSGGTTYIVVIGMPTQDRSESVGTTARVLLFGIPFVLLATALTTWWLVGRVLAPVDAIRRGAEEITSTTLSARVPEPATRDEVGRLARTMNAMLARLEAGHLAQQRFVSDASHELRSPLAGLRAALQVLARSVHDEPGTEMLELSRTEAARLERLVDDLLTLSKVDESGVLPHRSEDVDLDDVLAGEATRLKSTTDLRVDVTARPTRVSGDLQQLTRVIRNLADNAARAAHSRVVLSVRTQDDQAIVTVEDDGPGIPPEDRDRVFERFVRLDDSRSRDSGGSGLGLSIVRELVRGHGGWVYADAAADGGARFVLTLPLPDAALEGYPAEPVERDEA